MVLNNERYKKIKEKFNKKFEIAGSINKDDDVIEDDDVIDILKAMDTVAPSGSLWSASEPWGDTYSRDCWNIRTPEWWDEQLPDWEFEFYADYVLSDPPGRNKGFTAIKL